MDRKMTTLKQSHLSAIPVKNVTVQWVHVSLYGIHVCKNMHCSLQCEPRHVFLLKTMGLAIRVNFFSCVFWCTIHIRIAIKITLCEHSRTRSVYGLLDQKMCTFYKMFCNFLLLYMQTKRLQNCIEVLLLPYPKIATKMAQTKTLCM